MLTVRSFYEYYKSTKCSISELVKKGKILSGKVEVNLFKNEVNISIIPIVTLKNIKCTVNLKKPLEES